MLAGDTEGGFVNLVLYKRFLECGFRGAIVAVVQIEVGQGAKSAAVHIWIRRDAGEQLASFVFLARSGQGHTVFVIDDSGDLPRWFDLESLLVILKRLWQIAELRVAGSDIDQGSGGAGIDAQNFFVLLDSRIATIIAAKEMRQGEAHVGVVGVFLQIFLKELEGVRKVVLTAGKLSPNEQTLAVGSAVGELQCLFKMLLTAQGIVVDVAVHGATKSRVHHGEIRIRLKR